MLAKTKRLPKQAFGERYMSRERFSYGSIGVLPYSPAGAAVVVSKKVAPRAHDRNRIRRRTYHALGKALDGRALLKSVVIFPTRSVLTADFTDLALEIQRVIGARIEA